MVKCINKGCRKHTQQGERECIGCITKHMEWEARRDDVIASVVNVAIKMIESGDDDMTGYIADVKAGKLEGFTIKDYELTQSHADFTNMVPDTEQWKRTKRIYKKIVDGIEGKQPWIWMAVHQLAKTY